MQSGRLNTADELLKKSLKIEETEFGARPEYMAELYQSISYNAEEIQNIEGCISLSDIPMITSILDNFDKAIDIRKTLTGERNKMELGRMLTRSAFYYGQLQVIPSLKFGAFNRYQGRSIQRNYDARKIFDELNDEAQVADCLITLGTSFGKGQQEKLKYLKEAEELLWRTVGEMHYSMTRVYLNIGRFYDEIGFHLPAFKYFYKWYELVVELYGKEHSRSIRAMETLKTLRMPLYASYCREKGIDVPELID